MRKTPASLRSDPRLLWPGLPGRFAPDWVADLRGIRSLQLALKRVRVTGFTIGADGEVRMLRGFAQTPVSRSTLGLQKSFVDFQVIARHASSGKALLENLSTAFSVKIVYFVESL